eukprot:gene25813-biopygen22510
MRIWYPWGHKTLARAWRGHGAACPVTPEPIRILFPMIPRENLIKLERGWEVKELGVAHDATTSSSALRSDQRSPSASEKRGGGGGIGLGPRQE